jgi:hypothetical protein
MSLGDRVAGTGGLSKIVALFEILLVAVVFRLGWELGGWLLRRF